ncbi:EH domain-containing protein 1-like [Lytechinus variegatus]|uniref:EH domain-containing protein 1-like n=1 Tax=Lytechinus variegatus TaxID=7654 RepID=UPI001BB22198|nr:EH domain-containing protein 1-like [Lytechinus variegatus]
MFTWLNKDEARRKQPQVFNNVLDGLKDLYQKVIFPLEDEYRFHEFHSPALDEADFTAKPMILLVGQYSTGKTTFIKYLLEQEFPGMRVGPEPTTDRFIAVMKGETDQVIPGNALVVDPKRQFRKMSKFGNAFLNRFQCSLTNCAVLDSITIIDTPGILSGEKQRLDRGYDFVNVLEWFAERADRIILLFDAHKLDISDEFRRCIEAIKTQDEKIRIVLNKSDMIDHQQLMRVYGALMWSLGKVINTPEVSRVYIGSFWNKPLHYDVNRMLFEAEEVDLFSDLQSLPRNAALRKLNDLIKRARLAKVHAYVMSILKRDMPSMFGKEAKKKELINNLPEVYKEVERTYQISPGDFPSLSRMREVLKDMDFTKFHTLKPRMIEKVDSMLGTDMTRLMQMIPTEEALDKKQLIRGGAFTADESSPFGRGYGVGADYGKHEIVDWVVEAKMDEYEKIFESLGPLNGKISGTAAKKYMVKSKLPNLTLGRIWKLSDVDRDGMLDKEEFGLCLHLIDIKLDGSELPAELPLHLVPTNKRGFSGVDPK